VHHHDAEAGVYPHFEKNSFIVQFNLSPKKHLNNRTDDNYKYSIESNKFMSLTNGMNIRSPRMLRNLGVCVLHAQQPN
jgi:hypothetical protein